VNILTQMLQKRKEDGINQGFWIYNTFDDEFICCTERTIDSKTGKKQIRPWIIEDFKVKNKFISGQKNKPIYNLQLLKKYPEKYVLIVEGEKTADAASILFPEFNVITWMGGCQSVKNVDFSHLKDKTVYLLPDNDEVGYKAMELVRDKLIQLDCKVHFVDIKRLGVEEGWDVADLDNEHGEIDSYSVREKVLSSSVYTPKIDMNNFDVNSYPCMSDSKKPFAFDVTENLEHLLNHFNVIVKWNMLKRERQIYFPNKKFYNEEEANESLTLITDLAVKNQFNIRRIDKHLDAIAFKSRYHPVRDWILSQPVKDQMVFDKFLKILKTTNDQLSQLLLKRWLISAVATVFNESDFRAQGVLVLQGKGGWQKTTFIASLVPKEMDAIYTGATLDPSSKDSVLTLSEYWIAELGELGSTFKKSDINKLKAHITQTKDNIRRPFALKNSKMLRRTIFAASVNEENFLVDETGNRRWWVISLTDCIDINHGIDMQQVWRCAYDLWISGERPYLNQEEMELLNGSNEEFEVLDPFLERVNERYDFSQEPDRWLSATVVLEQIGFINPSRSDATRMGLILTKLGLKKKKSMKANLFLMPVLHQKYR